MNSEKNPPITQPRAKHTHNKLSRVIRGSNRSQISLSRNSRSTTETSALALSDARATSCCRRNDSSRAAIASRNLACCAGDNRNTVRSSEKTRSMRSCSLGPVLIVVLNVSQFLTNICCVLCWVKLKKKFHFCASVVDVTTPSRRGGRTIG